ncbi:MAG: hypothetical protein AAFQ87_27940, partial [Bacteroidota bacterium]
MKHLLIVFMFLGSFTLLSAQTYQHEIRLGYIFPGLYADPSPTGTLPSLHYRYHRGRWAARLGVRYSPNVLSSNIEEGSGTENSTRFLILEAGAEFRFRRQ